MPDLVGPNPCEWCAVDECVTQGGRVDTCPEWRSWKDRFAMLKALKEGGVKVECRNCYALGDCERCIDGALGKHRGPGHLIFIPEAQE